jgi:hypothetical protein
VSSTRACPPPPPCDPLSLSLCCPALPVCSLHAAWSANWKLLSTTMLLALRKFTQFACISSWLLHRVSVRFEFVPVSRRFSGSVSEPAAAESTTAGEGEKGKRRTGTRKHSGARAYGSAGTRESAHRWPHTGPLCPRAGLLFFPRIPDSQRLRLCFASVLSSHRRGQPTT